jgi:hypothetical protein
MNILSFPVGRWLKPRIPGAIQGQCEECTEKQTKAMQQILAFIKEKRPEDFSASVAKYSASA